MKMTWREGVSLCRRTAARLLAALGLLVVTITFTPLVQWWAARLHGPWNDPRGDVLILLSGDVNQRGVIGLTSYWRSVYAVWAWQEGGFRTLVVSGEASISEPIHRFLVSQGVPASAIVLEDRSNSTRENALFTAELLRDAPGVKVLLTSDYHMYRAHRAFQKAGLHVLPRPFPDVAKHANSRLNRWGLFLLLSMETTKIAYYKLQGWI